MQRIHAAAYEWHNYGKSTIGNRSDIERVPIENLQAFYSKYYQPDNVVLIVAGKFEEKKALDSGPASISARFPSPTRKLDDTYTEEPAQDGERSVILRRVGGVGAVGVAYHMPAAAHPDWAPLTLLAGIISQQPNGRLVQGARRIEESHERRRVLPATTTTPACSPSPRRPSPNNSTTFATRCSKRSKGSRPSRSRRRKSIRPRFAAAEPTRCGNPTAVACRKRSVRRIGARRLAPAVRAARPPAGRHGRRRQSRGQDLFPEAESHRRHVHSRRGADSGWRSPPRRRSIRSSRTTRAAR